MSSPNQPAPSRVRGAVLYARVSTDEQVEHGTSLEGQREMCRVKALSLSLAIVAEYEDAGISCALLQSRPGMQAALSDIQSGRADTLICANLSRYSRNTEHQQSIKNEVQKAGGRIVFCDMNFEETPEGDLAFGIMGNFAQYERQVIRGRTMRGKRRRAQEGQQPQRSRPPYGYAIVTNAQVAAGLYPPEMRGRYLVDESKAPVARRIFSDYHTGLTLSKIARLLNQEGILAPSGGARWMPATVRVILLNPVYKGQPLSGRQQCRTDESRLTQFHKLTGRPITTADVRQTAPEEHRLTLSAPSLVSETEWDGVQRRMAANRETLRGEPRRAMMLSGKTL